MADCLIAHVLAHTAVLREDEAVGHERVDGADGRVGHVVLVDQAVAVGNPVLTVAAVVACRTVVILLSPGGIRVVVPEGACPGADRGVEEDVALQFLAHVTFEADDAFGILIARVACIRTCGRELGRNAVKLEEAEVALVLREVVGSILEDLVVVRIGEYHLFSPVSPIFAAVVTAGAITAHRTEPCTDTGTHFGGRGGHIPHLIGEAGVESPSTVVVPTIIDDEAVGGDSVTVVEVRLPVVDYIDHLVARHVLRGVGRIVAVDVQLIPGDVGGIRTPGYGTLTL